MPDDNRFDSIADAMDEEDDETESATKTEPREHTMSESEPETTTSSTNIDEEAFGADETAQRPAYAREETWDLFDDVLDLDVEQALRERGIRDATKREKIDAVLRLAVDRPDEVADRVLNARREQ